MSQPTPKFAIAFMIVAAGCLVAGVSMGIAMGIAHDFALAPVHAHLNLLGWASLALMGLTYRAWPELASNRLAASVQFALSAGSAMVFPVGIYIAISHGQPLPAILAAIVGFTGAVLFLGRLVALALADSRRHLPAAMAAAPRA